MNNRVGGIVGDLKDNNMQESMRGNDKGREGINLDYKLSMYFYNFLSEKSDKLPTYEFIDKIVSMYSYNTSYQIISVGFGISVFVSIIDGERYINIEVNSPINENVVRIDKISKDSHDAYATNSFFVDNIDVEEFPLYNKERVSYLRKYLREYRYNNENSKTR